MKCKRVKDPILKQITNGTKMKNDANQYGRLTFFQSLLITTKGIAGFHCHAIKNKNRYRSIKLIMSRIWDVIDDWYLNNHGKIKRCKTSKFLEVLESEGTETSERTGNF